MRIVRTTDRAIHTRAMAGVTHTVATTPILAPTIIDAIEKRFRDTLMFDPVQAPSLRHALELVNAAILEADSRLRHQVLDRARDQDFAGTRFRRDAGTDVKRETEHLGPAHFIFARVQPHPDLQPQRAHCLADRGCATDPGNRRAERREQSVPRRHDFLSAQGLQLSTDGGVIMIHHLCPTRITKPRGFFGGPNDVDKQNRGERLFEFGATTDGSAPDRNMSRQRLIAMVASPRDCGFCIVFGTLHRAATNCFHSWWKRPVNLSPVSGAMDLDSAPLQENGRANPSSAPCL